MAVSPVLSFVGHKDTQYTKIFVGGLPYLTTDQTLREYFDKFGDIEEAVVITDRQTGKSRGYGFVTMTDRISAERACKDPNPIIDGRKANVNLAYLGAKPRQNGITGVMPYAIKSVPGILSSQFGYPTQYVFPSSYLNTPSPTSPRLLAPVPATSTFSSSQTGTPTQYAFDYTSAYAAATAGQFAGYDVYSPYTAPSPPANYGIGFPACYTYSTLQQPMAASTAPFHQFQHQPIQERL